MSARDEDQIDPALLEAELARPLEPTIRDALTPAAPPPSFADRVLLAQAQPAAASPGAPWWKHVLVGTATAAVVVVGVLGLRALPGRDAVGQAQPLARESVTLGGRGIAVAEAGSELSWKVEHDRAEIDQRAGSVFYRVERGGPFVVHTPAGDVEVRGTCFSVEVTNMKIAKQGIIGAGVGAALAATVVVAVYEGKVSYANEHGQVALSAGERAAAQSGAAPRALSVPTATLDPGPAPSTLSREELVQRAEAQQRELASLRERVHALEGGGGVAGEGGSAGKRADRDEDYLHPSKEDLAELAKECRLKWDSPSIGLNPQTIDTDRAAEMGLSESERQAMNKLNAEFNGKITAELRGLYVELTGDAAGADSLSPRSLVQEVEEKSPRADLQAVFQRLARERAGLTAPPADTRGLSPTERLMRLQTTLGDRYERALGGAIGPDLAHKLREDNDGWGSKHGSSYGCPDGK